MFFFLPLIVITADFYQDYVQYSIENGYATIKGYQGSIASSQETLSLPQEVSEDNTNYYEVKYIEANAFQHCFAYREITLPPKLTTIRTMAFFMSSFTGVLTIPNQ